MRSWPTTSAAVGQDCRVSTEGGTKAVLAALAANVGIGAISKFVAFIPRARRPCSPRPSTPAADSTNQPLLLLGEAGEARRGPHAPVRYARVRYVYAFVVSIVLFLVGGIFSLYEGFPQVHPSRGTA